MKKIIACLLLVISIVSITSCQKNYVLAENTHLLNSVRYITLLNGITYDMAIDAYYDHYTTDKTTVYVPRSGEFETKCGKRFTSEVGDLCSVHFLEDTTHSRICFDIAIYDESGNLIIKKDRFCSYVQTDTKEMDLTYVSEEFRDYWQAIAVPIDEIR